MDAEKIFWAFVAVAVLGMAAFAVFGAMASPVYAQGQYPAAAGAESPAQGGTLAAVSNGVQEVGIYVEGGTYYPNPIRVKKGIPVRLVADMSRFPGCSRSIVIPDFGVKKVVGAGDNVIEFTPGKSGTFSFSCSMGMYRGTIVVEEADGSVAAFTGDAPKATAGSCGMGSGCGCGG
ncbi:MAG: cupredoxin domain-containing protein [Candidatus Micrarchaeia archaeon]|jgi:hypothetical protein